MTWFEIYAIYGAPLVLVVGAALIAWRNHILMNRARTREQALGHKT